MSNGGEEREREGEYYSSKRVGSNDYERAVSRVAVAQICEGVGFDCSKESALEALSDIAARYIFDLGKIAVCYANLAGRSECNVFDIVKGLEDLGFSIGFSGASEVNHYSAGLGVVMKLIEFVRTEEEIPFVQPIPRFPVFKSCKGILSFLRMGEVPSGKNIPAWLPAFPDPHTYIHSPAWNERKTDPQADKVEQARQRRKAERSLLNLQQRLLSNGSSGPSGSVNHVNAMQDCSAGHVDAVKASGAVEDNPFLALPLEAGEKDVSSIALPTKLLKKVDDGEHGSVLETFAPAIDAIKWGGISDSGDLGRRVLSDRRPIVHFRLKGGRKKVGEDLDVNLKNKCNEQKVPWVGRDEEKDDKKRRAELILRQSMENPQELT
ncbi:hypothetical protein Nepgr_011668 [Nepenthes gracilis]|uniref:Transcription initiation factor TFIID subunit 8 n=1 Tax=Nepenthes gracilis TaxID=150966 RepID=A0AAD3SFX1_NEPGR|nr:hypothetical protein Nepgr_011668 [Nepenthes gracilis]